MACKRSCNNFPWVCMCVCVLLIWRQEHLLRSVWHRSELTLSPAAVKNSMFSVFMLDNGHLTDGLQTIPPVEKNTPVRVTEHLPEHPSHLSGCAYSCLQLPVTLYHWSHWHQCNSLVNACFSSGGDCKSLYKHSLTFDSEEKPKGSYDSKCESCPEHSVA